MRYASYAKKGDIFEHFLKMCKRLEHLRQEHGVTGGNENEGYVHWENESRVHLVKFQHDYPC